MRDDFRVSGGPCSSLRIGTINRRTGIQRQPFPPSTAGGGGTKRRLGDRLHLQRRRNDQGAERGFRKALWRARRCVAGVLGQGVAAHGGGKKSEPLGLRRGRRFFARARSAAPGGASAGN